MLFRKDILTKETKHFISIQDLNSIKKHCFKKEYVNASPQLHSKQGVHTSPT